MKNTERRISMVKRGISALLTVIMLISTIAVGISPLEIKVDAANVSLKSSDKTSGEIVFIVPEVIYLTPSTSTTDEVDFQYYMNNDSSNKPLSSKDTSGTIYYGYSKGDISASLSYSFLNANMTGSVSNVTVTTKATTLTLKATTQSTTFTGKALANRSCYIQWCLSYSENGISKTAYAYTYIYGTFYGAVAATANAGHTFLTYAIIETSWISGIHSIVNSYPDIAETKDSGSCMNPPLVDSSVTGGFKNWKDDSSSTSVTRNPLKDGTGANYYATTNDNATCLGGTGLLMIDSSRYKAGENKYSDIPNFSVGLDINNNYGYFDPSKSGAKNDERKGYYLIYDNTPTLKEQSTYESKTGKGTNTVNNKRYSSTVDKIINTGYTVIQSWGIATCSMSDTTKATSGCYCLLKYIDKNDIRTAVNNATKVMAKLGIKASSNGTLSSEYFDPNDNNYKFNTFVSKYKDAVKVLTKLDGYVTNYDDQTKINTLATDLNSAINALCTKVTYNANGGSLSGTSVQYLQVGGDNTVVDKKNINPSDYGVSVSRTGYTFKGWSTSSSASTGSTSVEVGYNETVYAIWAIDQHTLSIDSNNGSNNNNYSKVVQNYGTTRVIDNPSRIGYTFSGWTHTGGGSFNSGVYTFGTSDGTITANWSKNYYNITYSLNGGDLPHPQNYNRYVNSGKWEQTNPTKVYYDGTVGNSNVTDIDKDGTTRTLNEFDIWFRVENPTRTGYTFDGWNITGMDSCTHYYWSGGLKNSNDTSWSNVKFQEMYNLNSTNNSTVNFSAQWTPIEYTITYDVDGGTSISNKDYTIASRDTLPKPVKTGHTFVNWKVTSAGGSWTTNSTFSEGTSLNGKYGNVTLKAIWSTNSSTLEVDPNTGVWNTYTEKQTYTQDYNTTLSIPKPTKTGYTFTGWTRNGTHGTLSSTTDNATYTFGTENGVTDIITAQWDPNQHNVTLMPNGKANSTEGLTAAKVNNKSSDTITVTYDSIYSNLTEPNCTGYIFDGWYTTPDENVSVKDDGDAVEITSTTTCKTDANQILYAHWHRIVVTFDLNKPDTMSAKLSSVPEMVIIPGEKYGSTRSDKKMPNIEIDGWTFEGWYTQASGGNKITEQTDVPNDAVDQTLYAHWTANNYTVSLSPNKPSGASGTVSVTPTTIIRKYDSTYGKDASGTDSVLPTPKLTGYTFIGWYTDETSGDKVENTTKVTTASNHTLYAHWEANTYRVGIDYNDGTYDSIDARPDAIGISSVNSTTKNGVTYSYDSTNHRLTVTGKATEDTTIISVALTQPGGYRLKLTPIDTTSKSKIRFTVAGTKDDYSGSSSAHFFVVTQAHINDNQKIIVEVLSGKTYSQTVEFHLVRMDDGVTAKYGSNMPTSISVPSRIGYIFSGYYYGNTQYYNDNDHDGVISSSKTWNQASNSKCLTAKWTPKQCTVEFNKQGGSGGSDNVTATYDSAMPSATMPTRLPGYTFKGYFDGENGTGKEYYDNGGKSKRTWDKDTTENTTLYAFWQANTHTVTLDDQNATEKGTESVIATYDLDMPTTDLVLPKKTGYTFQGYYSQTEGNGTQYYDYRGESAQIMDYDKDVTLYAYWTKNSYAVSYVANKPSKASNNPTETVENTTHTYDTKGNLSTKEYYITGWTFTGWDTKSDGTGTSYSSGAEVKNLATEGVFPLYAQWKQNEYKVIYNKNKPDTATGVVSKQILPTTHKYDEKSPISSEEYTLEGWEFIGWNTSPDGKGTDIEPGDYADNWSTAADYTLYAKWEANAHTIYFERDWRQSDNLFDLRTWKESDSSKAAVTGNVESSIDLRNGSITVTQKVDGITGGAENNKKQITNSAFLTNGYKIPVTAGKEYALQFKADSATLGMITFRFWTSGGAEVTDSLKYYYYLPGSNQGDENDSKLFDNGLQAYPDNTDGAPNGSTDGRWIIYFKVPENCEFITLGFGTRSWNTILINNGDSVTFSNISVFEVSDGTNVVDTLDEANNAYYYTKKTWKYNDEVGVTSTVVGGVKPEGTGYSLEGWYSREDNTKVTSVSDTTDSDVYVYSKWTANSYKIKYAGTNRAATTAEFDKVVEISVPTKTGYTFTGWTVSGTKFNRTTARWGTTDGNVLQKIADGQKLTGKIFLNNLVTEANVSDDDTVTLTANWSANTYYFGIDNDNVASRTNLYNKSYVMTGTVNGLTTSVSDDGVITINGTTNSYESIYHLINPLTSAGAYRVTLTPGSAPGSYTKTKGSSYFVCELETSSGKSHASPRQYKDNTSATMTYYFYVTPEILSKKAYIALWTWVSSTVDSQAKYDNFTVKVTIEKLDDYRSVTFDSALPAVDKPSKTGYTFNGYWSGKNETGTNYYDNNCNTKVSKWTVSNSQTVMYPKWTANKYYVRFNPNGGTGEMDNQEFTYDAAEQALTANTFEKNGYKFDGWSTSEGVNNTKVYEDKAELKNLSTEPNAIVDIYAVWNPNNYKVTLNANTPDGATGEAKVSDKASIEITRKFDSTYGKDTSGESSPLPTPDLPGYHFDGWYTSAGTLVTDGVKVTTYSDHTLYAHWTANNYTVTLDANKPSGATGTATVTPTSVTRKYDSTYGKDTSGADSVLPTPVLNGYHFDGWYTDATNGTKVEDDTKVTTYSDHTLYAHWTANNYTVTLDANTPTGATGSAKVSGEASVEITRKFDSKYGLNENGTESKLPVPVLNGYDFKGWYTKLTGGSPVSDSTDMLTADVHTLYAHWEARTYKIKYVLPEVGTTGTGINPTSNVTSVNFDQVLEISPATGKTGYTFAGWTISETGLDKDTAKSGTSSTTVSTAIDTTKKYGSTGKVWLKNLSPVANTEITLTANWTPNNNKVTFNMNGVTPENTDYTKELTATFDSEMPYPDGQTWLIVPNKNGYTFKGYYDSSNKEGGKQYYSNTGVSVNAWDKTSATTLYARWEKSKSYLVIKPMGGTYNGSTDEQTLYKEYEDSVSITKPTREGFEFEGWTLNDHNNGSVKWTDEKQTSGTYTFGPKGGETDTLTALWKPKPETLTENPDGTFNDAPMTGVVSQNLLYMNDGAAEVSGSDTSGMKWNAEYETDGTFNVSGEVEQNASGHMGDFMHAYLEKGQEYILTYTINKDADLNGTMYLYTRNNKKMSLGKKYPNGTIIGNRNIGDRNYDNGDGTVTYIIHFTAGTSKLGEDSEWTGVADTFFTGEYTLKYDINTLGKDKVNYTLKDVSITKPNLITLPSIGTNDSVNEKGALGHTTSVKAFDYGYDRNGTVKVYNGNYNHAAGDAFGEFFMSANLTNNTDYVLTYTTSIPTLYFHAKNSAGKQYLKPVATDGDAVMENDDGTYTYVVYFTAGVEKPNLGMATCTWNVGIWKNDCSLQFYIEGGTASYNNFSISQIGLYERTEYEQFKQGYSSSRYLISPRNTGYHIDHWEFDGTHGGTLNGLSYTYGNGNDTVNAVWAENTYNINYVLDEGDEKPDERADAYSGITTPKYSDVVEVTVPSRRGFTFTGWTISDSTGVAKVSTDGITFEKVDTSATYMYSDTVETFYFKNLTSVNNGTVTLTAHWVANTYVVRFDRNGGTSGYVNSMNFTYGESQNLNSIPNDFKRQHTITYKYNNNVTADTTDTTTKIKFLGWSQNKNATTPDYEDGASVKNLVSGATGDKTCILYAIWQLEELTLPEAAKTGETLEGWYNGTINCGVAGEKYAPESNVILRAHWRKNQYFIDFKGGDYYSNGTMDPQMFEYGADPQEIDKNIFTKEYQITFDFQDEDVTPDKVVTAKCDFDRWYTKINDEDKYYGDCEEIQNLTIVDQTRFEFTAQWKTKTITLPTPPEREGYEFTGWYTEAGEGKGDKVGMNGEEYEVSANAGNHSVILYAHWLETINRITFDNCDSNYNYFSAYTGTVVSSGFEYKSNGDGTITINGVSDNVVDWTNFVTVPFYPVNGETYDITVDHVSGESSQGNFIIQLIDTDGNVYNGKVQIESRGWINDYNIDNYSWKFANGAVTSIGAYNGDETKSLNGKTICGIRVRFWNAKKFTNFKLKINIVRTETSTATPQKEIQYGNSLGDIVNLPQRRGATFAGYFDKKVGGTEYYDKNGSSGGKTWQRRKDITLYARWTPDTYKIKFTSDKHSNSYTQTVNYGEITTLTENQFTPADGEYLDFWSYDYKGVTYRLFDGESVYNLPGCTSGEITLKAHWGEQIGDVNYDIRMPYDFSAASNVVVADPDKFPGDTMILVSPNLANGDKNPDGTKETHSQLAEPDFKNCNYSVTVDQETFVITFTPGSGCYTTVTFYYEVHFGNYYILGRVRMYPANVVLYEETSFGENDSVFKVENNNGASWYSDGTRIVTNATESGSVLGFSPALETLEAGTFSGGTVSKTILTPDVNVSTTKEFQFTGTGFDVISACGTNTAAMVIYVWQYDESKDTYSPISITTVDTYVNDANLLNSEGLMTQVPIYHFSADIQSGVAHTYLVQVYAAYLEECVSVKGSSDPLLTQAAVIDQLEGMGLEIDESIFEMKWMDEDSVLNGGKGSEKNNLTVDNGITVNDNYFSLDTELLASAPAVMIGYLDGIRVYKPYGNNDPSIYSDSEKNSRFYNINQYAQESVGSSQFSSYTVSSVATLSDPFNEVYLKGNNGSATKTGSTAVIKLTGIETGTIYNVMLSVRAINGSPKLVVTGAGNSSVFTPKSIIHSTEMFYDITEFVGTDGIIVIENRGSGILAIGNIKISGTSESAVKKMAPESLDKSDIDIVLQMFADQEEYNPIGVISPSSYIVRNYDEESEPETEPVAKTEISIAKDSSRTDNTVEYRSTITFRSSVKNGDGQPIVWYVNGSEYKSNSDGTCTVANVTEDFKIFCETVGNDGTKVRSKTESVSVKHGFFDELLSILKNIFGGLPKVIW